MAGPIERVWAFFRRQIFHSVRTRSKAAPPLFAKASRLLAPRCAGSRSTTVRSLRRYRISVRRAGLGAIERPITPRDLGILFEQADKQLKPVGISAAVERLARAKFARPDESLGLRVEQKQSARAVGLLQLIEAREVMSLDVISVR
jgi:hypothetical protein